MSLRGESRGYVLAFGPAEFLDECEHQPLVLPEELAHLLAIFWLRRFGFGDCAGVEEVSVNLPVQIVAVRHHHEREVARLFAEDFAGVENHREAFARTLRVPEHAELALQFFTLEECLVGAVHADELVVLGDDLLVVFVVEDEVLDVIQQPVPGEQTRDHALQARALLCDFIAVNLFLLVLGAQPVEEMLPLRREAADLGLDGVREHAKGVGQEKLRDVLLVIGQVVVERGLEFHVRVFQFDEDQRDAVDVEQHVGTAEATLAFDPELRDGQITVLVWLIEINQLHTLLLLLALSVVELHRDAVAQQVVNFLVGGDERHGLTPVKQFFQRIINGFGRDVRVQADSGFFDPIHQDDIALIGAARAVAQILRVFRVTVERVEAVKLLKLLHQRPLNLVLGDEVRHGRVSVCLRDAKVRREQETPPLHLRRTYGARDG